MRVLVLGDRIIDHYQFCKAVRLCPEGPAPVLHIESERTSEGGASNIAENLKSLLGEEEVKTCFGSVSHKHRLFAGHTLLSRVDRDRYSVLESSAYWNQILSALLYSDAVVIGDYNKGAINPDIAKELVTRCNQNSKPLFVDSKADPKPYEDCFAIFPNEEEHNHIHPKDYQHIIRKLGPKGCSVDGYLIPTEEKPIFDVTGAGDCFLAGFVWKWCSTEGSNLPESERLILCARAGNQAGGISVTYLGTHTIKPGEML